MIIAVDADGTLFDKKWYPNVPPTEDTDEYNLELIDLLIERKKKGDKIILWTCREGRPKTIVVRVMQRFGLTFDAVNGNVESYAHAKKKIVADLYVDDKAARPEELPGALWEAIIAQENGLLDDTEHSIKELDMEEREILYGSSTTE